jgi:predicted ATP-dependent protease
LSARRRVCAAPAPLAPPQLRWRCDPDLLGFATTAEVPPLEGTLGQERGVDAIILGLNLDAPGYNLYVAGPSGTGRTTTVRQQVARVAAQRRPASDWCYLHNFEEPAQPIALQLPAGRGRELAQDVEHVIAVCQRDIPKLFESEQYERDRQAVVQRLHGQREQRLEALAKVAEQLGFELSLTPTGILTTPLRQPGKPMSQEAFELLPDEEKAAIRARSQQLDAEIEETMRAIRRLEREVQEQLRALDRQAVLFAVGHVVDDLRRKYVDTAAIAHHLDAIQSDLIEHLDEFRSAKQAPESAPPDQSAYHRFRVNVLVTSDPTDGAPVVFEPNPTYYNLSGRIDYRATVGAMYTDTTLIRAGALHRANGGFLVLEARDVLLNPFSWDALKRALRDGEVRIENLGEQLSAFPTAVLKPQPIPLRVKVVLVGDLTTFMLLYQLDEDFHKLFKIKAQFGPTMERTPDTLRAYAGFISSQVQARALLPFCKDAVAQVIEQAVRLADDQERLTTAFDEIVELAVEASYWAQQAGAPEVHAGHVARALAEQERRANLLEVEVQRMIQQQTITIATRTEVTGQVNGLSIIDLGDYTFAHPTRITARTGMGSEGVVNVEREARLSGRTHSKGVMTLTGYLLGMYAHEQPLSLSARLAFEQVYSEVDGDSASSAELYALLSSLADVPIKQAIAVTGSVNQRGEIQAIGGVTRKIEGFFTTCVAQGLSGEQGVVIPQANVRHLMLKQEVLDAVAAGQFHVWAVRTVDEGIALLTGLPAGERRPDGSYPEGTIHGRVQSRLATLATHLTKFAPQPAPPAAPSLAPNGMAAPSASST